MKVKELVYQKLKEKGMSKSILKDRNIWEENLDTPCWETAVKLSGLLGETPDYWMGLYEKMVKKT